MSSPSKSSDESTDLQSAIRVAVIGAGNWGKNLVKNFNDLGALAAVAETNPDLRAKVLEDFPGVTCHESFKDLLDADIDAVAIATPVPTHHAIAKLFLEAGKDVFVEKPMTLTVSEAEDLHETAQKYERILMVGHLLLYQPAITFVRDYIHSGKLGRIRSMHQRRSKLGRVRNVENVLWSFGVHDVAVLLHLAGGSPVSIGVHGHAGVTHGVEDDVYLHLGFAEGFQANLHNSWFWPRVERELIIAGEKGILVFDEINHQVVRHWKTVASDLLHHDEGEEVLFKGSGSPLRIELEHFLKCCTERVTPLSDGKNGCEVIKVLEEAERQLRA